MDNALDSKEALLQRHLDLVLRKNKSLNLTRIDDDEQGRLLHIEDSLAALPEFTAAPEGRAADLGTGGGYPGIPLAVMSGRSIDLVESITKKAHAVEEIVEELGIANQVAVVNERAEELATERPEGYSVVVARALAALPSLIELASPLLCTGGVLIAYKSITYHPELDAAVAIQDKLGMHYAAVRELVLSDNATQRSIITFKKVSKPRVKLPRRPGMAQKNPYRK